MDGMIPASVKVTARRKALTSRHPLQPLCLPLPHPRLVPRTQPSSSLRCTRACGAGSEHCSQPEPHDLSNPGDRWILSQGEFSLLADSQGGCLGNEVKAGPEIHPSGAPRLRHTAHRDPDSQGCLPPTLRGAAAPTCQQRAVS